jgi:uroporphyrin-III C-methyltransferase
MKKEDVMQNANASQPFVHPVIFVGAGPGAADLLTLRAVQRLKTADVILYDALTDPALQAFAPQAEWIFVGKRGFCDSTSQTAINALLVKLAQQGRRVVRLKGGDPSIFGRLEEEIQALRVAQITCEVVPGVTAAIAAAASIQRPLTRRGTGRTVTLTTAMTERPPASPPSAADNPLETPTPSDSIVYYMAGKQLPALARQLSKQGWAQSTPVCVVSRASCIDELHSSHSVDTLAQASLLHKGRPTVVIVGAAAVSIDAPANQLACDKSNIQAVPLKTALKSLTTLSMETLK